MMEFETVQIVNLLANAGILGAVARLLWKMNTRITVVETKVENIERQKKWNIY